jgi:hypothetical protein
MLDYLFLQRMLSLPDILNKKSIVVNTDIYNQPHWLNLYVYVTSSIVEYLNSSIEK